MEVDAYSLLQMHKTRRSFDSSRASPASSPSPKKKPKTPKLTRVRSMRTPSVTSIFSSMSDRTRSSNASSEQPSGIQPKSRVPTPSIASSKSSASVSTNGSYVSKHVLSRDNSAGSSVAERRFQFESSGPPSPGSRSRGQSNNSTPNLNRGDSWGNSSTGSGSKGSKFPPRTFVFQPSSQPPTPTTTGPSNSSSSFPPFGSAPQRSFSFEPRTRPSTVRVTSDSKSRPSSPTKIFGSESNEPLPTPRLPSANNSRPPSPTKPLHASPNTNFKTLSPIQGSPDIKSYNKFGTSIRGGRRGTGEEVGLGILNVEDSEGEFDDISSCISEATERVRPLSVAESTSTLARGIAENDILDSYITDRKTVRPAAGGEDSVLHQSDPIPAGIDNIQLIEQLLESNYRGQAETFVKASSRSSSLRSLSRSTSASSPLARPTPPSRSATLGAPSTSPAPEGSYETQTRSAPSFAASQRSASIRNSLNKGNRTPSGRTILESYEIKSPAPKSPQSYAYRVYQVPSNDSPTILKRPRRNTSSTRDRLIYFTEEEIIAIQAAVDSRPEGYGCKKHENCTDCREIEYSKLENQAMPTSMPPEERQKIINNNRSLRNIKNELENLAENGCIDDNVFDQIMSILPSESSLNASARSNAAPSPAPTAALNNMRINNDPPPPAYSTPTPPSLPNRSTPSKPEIARATALYRYTEPEDCNFEVGDQISVYEYMNADWWLGKNIRTGKEGVFPVNYVQVQSNHATPTTPASHYNNEKVNNNGYPGMAQPQSQGPPPPGPSNPYNSSVPPMAVAQGSGEQKQPGKGGEMGKKFGKKLGNAAIFGAGATIGGNIVNSIF